MIIKIHYLYLCLLFLLKTFCFGYDIINKNEVLKLKPQICNEDKDCPNEAECYDGKCTLKYFCQNDKCIEQIEGTSFDQTIDITNYRNSTTTDLILESCPEEARNIEKCFTRYCIDDNNCYSNKCINNTCIVNNDFTTNFCVFLEYKSEMVCSKPDLDSCKKDSECFSEYCNEYHFCQDKPPSPYLYYAFLKLILYLIIIIIIIVIIIILLRKCCRRNKAK